MIKIRKTIPILFNSEFVTGKRQLQKCGPNRKDMKIKFDPDLVNRFMTYSRILEPDSKLGFFQNLNRYYEQPDFEYILILRTMDLMKKKSA